MLSVVFLLLRYRARFSGVSTSDLAVQQLGSMRMDHVFEQENGRAGPGQEQRQHRQTERRSFVHAYRHA